MATFLAVAPMVVEDVVSTDALSLLGTCREVHSLAGPHTVAAAAFALTRPSLGCERCSLGAWKRAWAQCAAEVEARGWNVDVWAYATLVQGCSSLGPGATARIVELSKIFIEELEGSLGQGIVGVLAASGRNQGPHHYYSFPKSILLLLSDGQFAFVDNASGLNENRWTWSVRNTFPDGGMGLTFEAGALELDVTQWAGPACPYSNWDPRDLVLSKLAPCRRRARDGTAYTLEEFDCWYLGSELVTKRWRQAQPVDDPSADRLARTLLQSRQTIDGASAGLEVLPKVVEQSSEPSAIQSQAQVLECVTQTVDHSEPPAMLCEAEAAAISDAFWMSFISEGRLAGAGQVPSAGEEADERCAESVFLLDFDRTPKQMLQALATGVPLRACRETLEAEGHNWKLLSGGQVFVHPAQYRSVMRALVGRHVVQSQVVVAASLEHLVEESLHGVGKGAHAKKRLEMPCQASSDSNSAAGSLPGAPSSVALWWGNLEVKRTFICEVRALRRPGSVLQSTTEAQNGAGLNPRRFLPHSSKQQ